MGGGHKRTRTQDRHQGSLEGKEKEDICHLAGVSAAHQPESPPPPESPPIARRSLRLPCFDPNTPECDSSQYQNRILTGDFHLTGVSAPTGLSGAHRPETPA